MVWRQTGRTLAVTAMLTASPIAAGPGMARAQDAAAAADAATAQTVEPAKPAAATVEDAIVAEVLAQVPVTGTLVARQEVQVYPQVSGFEIVEINADAGDRVEKGELLVRLSDATLRAQLEQARAEYQRAEAGLGQARSQVSSADATLNQAAAALDRAQRLQRSGNASQASLDQAVAAEASARAAAASSTDGVAVATAQVAQARAARDIAQLNLDRTRITAPVSGVISARNAELGALAGAGSEPLFTLVANGEIELAGEVIETALSEIRPGEPALLRVAGVGEVEGEVRLVPAAVDPVTRLGVLRISLDDAKPLRTGLFASGWITTERREAVTVPATAVLSSDDGDTLQVVKDGVVETRKVVAGLLWQERREIVKGLEAGETVIARAGAFFRNGDPVDPVYAKQATVPAEAPQPAAPAADTAAAGAASAAETPAATPVEAAPAPAPAPAEASAQATAPPTEGAKP